MTVSTWVFVVGATMSVLGMARAQSPNAAALPSAEIYTCIDANGRKLTSDRPIAACRDREQKILNPSGTVKARVGPTLTAKEQTELEARAQAQRAERARKEEERRQDRALLIRYPDSISHEKERQQALDNVSRSKQAALAQTNNLLAQRARLAEEMAFYEKDPSKAPPLLRHQYQEIDQSLAAQGRLLADFDAQIARINTRFDAELKRLQPLWAKAKQTLE